MTEEQVEAVAVALKECARGFSSCGPVEAYVENEALHRYRLENPEDEATEIAYGDEPNGRDGEWWKMESWRILARAALRALNDKAG